MTTAENPDAPSPAFTRPDSSPKPAVSTDRARRDLRWLLNQSPIITGADDASDVWLNETELKHLRDTLEQVIDDLPDAALAPAQAEHRCGRYVEALLVALIESSKEYDLLAHNLQVFEDKRTLGAFDLIVRDRHSSAVTHLELAFKQYLHRCGDPTQMNQWTGPRGRDRLDLKATHMVSRQLNLGAKAAARTALAHIGVAQLDHIRALMSGRLFIPYAQFQASAWPKLPDTCSQATSLGWWIDQADISNLKNLADTCRVLSPQWAIAPLDADDCRALPQPQWQRIQEQVQGGVPALIAITRNGIEISRGWVVNRDLP